MSSAYLASQATDELLKTLLIGKTYDIGWGNGYTREGASVQLKKIGDYIKPPPKYVDTEGFEFELKHCNYEDEVSIDGGMHRTVKTCLVCYKFSKKTAQEKEAEKEARELFDRLLKNSFKEIRQVDMAGEDKRVSNVLPFAGLRDRIIAVSILIVVVYFVAVSEWRFIGQAHKRN